MTTPRNSSSEGEALGLLETKGLVAALEAADAMLKAARVRLIRQERTVPALITSIIVGETAAVCSAIDAGQAAAERVGDVVSAHIIPRPAPDVIRDLALNNASHKVASRVSAMDLDSMTVVELRRRAREHGDDNFSGRIISKASKSELLKFLRGHG